MRVTPNIKQASVRKFAHAAFANGSVILSDGYCSYIPALENYAHEYQPYDPDSGLLHWLHVVISNAKSFILGTYHGLSKKYFQSYLDSTRPMTHHGLRHSYAARTYQELINSGMSPLSASLRVSQLLGHERPDVTRGYLASVQKDGADGK